MWHEIATWQEQLNLRPDLAAKTIALYTQDARRFATWLQQEHPGLGATEVTSTDAKTYRDHQGFRLLDVFAHLEWDAPLYESAQKPAGDAHQVSVVQRR